ncbi:MAG: D-aminoacyl-tRNA deacylase [bacterium]
MKAVIQRVSNAKIEVGDKVVAEIGNGLMILLGVRKGDTLSNADELAEKCANLRIFEDTEGKFSLSLIDIRGSALVASQFTLLADTSRGRRPSFTDAEEPKRAKQLYENFIESLNNIGILTRTGIFGERMNISLKNDGPVTIIMEV